MNTKKSTRLRRARRQRAHINKLGIHRLCVQRTLNHMYAQVISPCGSKVITAASTLESEVKTNIKSTGNKEAAVAVGKLIAKRAKEQGVEKIAFDRSGYKFHGRVKALADAAREGGLDF